MYSPSFHYTDKLVLNLVKIENLKTVISLSDLPYSVKQKLTQHAKATDLFHINHIINAELSLKDIEKVVAGTKLQDYDNDKYSIIMNFKQVQDFNRSTDADNFPEFDNSVIIHINKMMLNIWRETWEANYRNFNDKIDERWDTWLRHRDSTITGNQVEALMQELIDWYTFSIPTVSPIVRAAVCMFRMIEIAPFIAANKITLLAMLDYMLLKNGFSSKVYSSPAKIINSFEERLQKNIEATKQANDLSIWIEAFTSLVLQDLLEVRENLTKFVQAEEKSKQQPFLDLNKRQMKILKYLQTVPTIQREDFCQIMEVSTMTAFRDLNDLVRKNY